MRHVTGPSLPPSAACPGGCRNGMVIDRHGDSAECPICEGSGQA